jgi:hypothetical protein
VPAPAAPVFAAPAAVGAPQPHEVLPLPPEAASVPFETTLDADEAALDALREGLDGPAEGVWYMPTEWIGVTPWETSVEFGLNGSTGTNESVSIRAGGRIARSSRFSKLDLDTTYNRTTNRGTATQNNAQLNARHDWLLHESSPWTLYGTLTVFYDEFQAFDLQSNANTGVGYRFVDEPGLELIGRFGAGTSREFGGPDDRWVPESHLGFEYSQRLSAAQRFYGKFDYFPEWDQVGEYRLVADVGWELSFDHPSNMSLKLSATDRFDSTPNGVDPHLVNYSLLLLLKL